MVSVFRDRGVELMEMRRRIRANQLTHVEYTDFLKEWYNIILGDMATWKHTLQDLLVFIEHGVLHPRFDGAVPLHCLIATRPTRVEHDLGKYYVSLFKFIGSLPPYDTKQKHVARVLTTQLQSNGYEVVMKDKGDDLARASLYKGIFTFFV
jgi:hypothetical protein